VRRERNEVATARIVILSVRRRTPIGYRESGARAEPRSRYVMRDCGGGGLPVGIWATGKVRALDSRDPLAPPQPLRAAATWCSCRYPASRLGDRRRQRGADTAAVGLPAVGRPGSAPVAPCRAHVASPGNPRPYTPSPDRPRTARRPRSARTPILSPCSLCRRSPAPLNRPTPYLLPRGPLAPRRPPAPSPGSGRASSAPNGRRHGGPESF